MPENEARDAYTTHKTCTERRHGGPPSISSDWQGESPWPHNRGSWCPGSIDLGPGSSCKYDKWETEFWPPSRRLLDYPKTRDGSVVLKWFAEGPIFFLCVVILIMCFRLGLFWVSIIFKKFDSSSLDRHLDRGNHTAGPDPSTNSFRPSKKKRTGSPLACHLKSWSRFRSKSLSGVLS